MLVLPGTPDERLLKPEWLDRVVLYDRAGKSTRRLGIRALPTAVPVDTSGRSLQARYEGAKAIVNAIDALLHGTSYPDSVSS